MLAFGAMLSLAATGSLLAGEELKKGDRVVFLGDSITQAGARPGGYVTLVAEALAKRKPELDVEVIGAGISGNKVPDLEQRLQRDVLDKKPTVVVIYIGINDVWHSLNDRGTPKDAFQKGLHNLIGQIKQAGARVILSTPSVIGEKTDGSNKLDKMLDEYSEVSRKVAKETGSQLLDLHQQFRDYLMKHNSDNAEKNVLTTDGVHLNAAGNRFVADRMLEALGATESSGQAHDSVLRHVVLFKFKDEVSKEQVQEVVDAFSALPEKIDAIVDYECGTDVSVEGKAEGFTHGFVVTFKDESGREVYLPHPAHQEFVKLVGPRLEKVLVFDFKTQK
ncbi:MAG TPA: GDSL-type esterase/lipase family protein [Pirellulales bacterium]|nr:GDSL-type esterase/lipase family protein [Pirellulales bacterium]